MKKFLPIITGVLIGAAVAVGGIMLRGETAFGEEGTTWWNDFVAFSESKSFTWEDVFGPDKYGEDMYSLVYSKFVTFPGKSALKDVASRYGLTQDEARSVLQGTITPIFNNPDLKTRHITQEQAQKMMADMQEYFELANEAYALEQEVDATIKPSELFANGDLSDSGFDLVYDLTKIEEILFLEGSPVSVGAPYEGGPDSPNDPTDGRAREDGFLPNNTGVAVSPLEAANGAGGLNANGNLQIGDKEVEVDILEEDVCVDDSNALNAARDAFDEDNAGGDNEDDAAGAGEGDGGEGDGGDDDGNDEAEDDSEIPPQVQAAPADDWAKAWCKGVNSRAEEGDDVDVQIAVCLEITMIKKTVTSFQPGDSCIACELEQINTLLDKTLSHSLIPGKATGNLLESAKCKSSASLLNFQFITIWNPIPPPPKDDLIENKNVFEEWNKFVTTYKPLDITGSLLNMELETWDTVDTTKDPQSSAEFVQEFKQQSAPSGLTQQQLLNSMIDQKFEYQAEAVTNLKEMEVTSAGTNKTVYFDAILQEVQQMAAFFTNFSNTYKLIIDDALPNLCSKPDID